MKRKKKRPDNNHAKAPAMSMWRHDWLFGLFLVAITLVAYQPVWHAGFIWDDDKFLTDNPVIKSAEGLYRMWFTVATPDYFPMTSSMLWLEWRLWGNNPLGYHLVNVLLHALSAVLLWRVLLRLKIPGALLAAAIFALHPVNVESVAWITELKNTLCMFFYVGALLAWLKFEDNGQGRYYGLALVAFALALLSKTAVAPLPLVLLGIAWWRRGQMGWRDARRTTPFFVIATVLALVTVWFQSHQSIGTNVVRTDGFLSRLAGAGWAVWFYLYKAMLPLNLAFVYPHWQIDARNVLSYVPLALLAAVFALCWRNWQAYGKAMFFGLAYFVVMLLPVLGFLDIYFMLYSLVADHWEYFAIIGPIVLTAAIIRKPAVGAALLLILGVLTWKQCGMYANAETLWQTTLQQNPKCWLAYNSLGVLFFQNGRIDEAITQYQNALLINPACATAHNNLGLVFYQKGRADEALAHYQKALQIQPDFAEARNNLGNILLEEGKTDEAIAQYQKALQIQPDYAEAHNNLGSALLKMGKEDDAISQYREALRIDPGFAKACNNLGSALCQKGSVDEAIIECQKALRIEPDNASFHFNFALVLMQKGSASEAIAEYRKDLEITPADPKALNNLAWLLATSSQTSLRNGDKAIELARQASILTGGNNPIVLHTLAAAFAEAGRFGDAVINNQKAIELAQATGQQALLSQLNDELKHYKAGLPWHQ